MAKAHHLPSRFRAWDLGFRVVGFRVWGLGLWGLGFRGLRREPEKDRRNVIGIYLPAFLCCYHIPNLFLGFPVWSFL